MFAALRSIVYLRCVFVCFLVHVCLLYVLSILCVVCYVFVAECEHVCVFLHVSVCFTNCCTLFNNQFWPIFSTAVDVLQLSYLTKVVLALCASLLLQKHDLQYHHCFNFCYSSVDLCQHNSTTKNLCVVQERVNFEQFSIL